MMVGEYRVERELGTGSSGRVYEAIHPLISKRAAIKVLHPELTATREPLERFIQEARAANQIGHPHIVDIGAFGKLIDGRNYVVMECLTGETLRGRAQRTRMPIADALAIIGTITLALEAAHEKEITHRNLKPENVFLVEISGNRPHVKLLDFGIVNLMSDDASKRAPSAYLSPEQARGGAVDHRTDIYALGAITFELVTGQRVFEAKTAADMIAKHAKDKPRSASALNKEVPAQLDALIASMLAKTPEERPSLEKIRSELRACRLLVGGALTPPAGIPRMPPPDVEPSPARAKGKTTPPADKAAATAVATPGVNLPTAPSSGARAFVIGLVVLLLSAGIGLGVWMYMNQAFDEPAGSDEWTEPQPTPAPPPEPAIHVQPAPVPAPAIDPGSAAPVAVPPTEPAPAVVPPTEPAGATTPPPPLADPKAAAAEAAAQQAKAEAEAKAKKAKAEADKAKERRRARRRAQEEAANAAGSGATPAPAPEPTP